MVNTLSSNNVEEIEIIVNQYPLQKVRMSLGSFLSPQLFHITYHAKAIFLLLLYLVYFFGFGFELFATYACIFIYLFKFG